MKKIIAVIGALLIGVNIGSSFAWDNNATHMDLSKYAADQSKLGIDKGNYLKMIGFDGGLKQEFALGNLRRTVKDWLAEGGKLEDNGSRSLNHFHNPIKSWLEAGLSDIMSGQSSLLWAQSYRESQQPMVDDWSWQRTRKLYHLALTSWHSALRSSLFAETFKGLGQQMHLLQDMAVPYHVRNDGHPMDAIIGNNGRGSFFETWTKSRIGNLEDMRAFAPNPIQPQIIFSIPTDNGVTYSNLAPITQLYDTNQYDGANPSTSNESGLSEYTNANFFSDDTINMPNTWVSDGHSFPNPNANSTNLQDYIVSKALPTTIIAEDGVSDLGFWIRKTGDEPIEHFVKPGYVTNNAYDILGGGYIYFRTFVLDDACHHDYAEKLLPRAVGYSAALLDYFFRGTLEIAIPDTQIFGIADGSQTPYLDTYGNRHQQFTKVRAKVRNTTINEAMGTGKLQAVARYKIIPNYAPDLSNYPPSGQAMSSVQNSYSVSAMVDVASISSASFADYTFNFDQSPIPAGITDLTLQVVFKGTIGNEIDSAIAVGMRDISEPTHLVFWNLSDRFSYGTTCVDLPGYLCYKLVSAEDIENNTVLKNFLTQQGYNYAPTTHTFSFTFNASMPSGILPPVAQAVVQGGQHARIIALVDGQSTPGNYVQLQWQGGYFSEFFSGAITQIGQDGSLQPTPTTTFRYHGSVTAPAPFVQHFDTGVVQCYPELSGGGCPYPESDAPPADPTPVSVQILIP